MRARIVYASNERVKQTSLTYEDLADPQLEGQDLHPLRPALLQHALFAAHIVKHGEAQTEQWLAG